MFCYFVNRYSFHFVKFLEFLGFNSFWINVFLWLPVKLALLELKFKYGSLENYLEHCEEQRNRRNEKNA
jgi:hypothetical protein